METPSNSVDEASSSSSEIAVVPHVAIANINPAGLTISLKLSRDNFLLWKTQLLPVLAAYDLVALVDQDPPMVSHVDKDGRICPNPAYKTWFKNDQVVLAIITSSLSESVLPILVGKNTAREAWEAINRNFAGKSKSRIMELQTRLHNLRKDTMTVDDYVQLVRSLGDELRVSGSMMNEHDLTFALLRGLGSTYNPFFASTSLLLDSLTFDDVACNLKTYESHLQRQSEEHKTHIFPPTAHITQTGQSEQGYNRGGRTNRGRGRNQGRNTPRCQLCFKPGHRVVNCYERFNRDFVQPPWQTNHATGRTITPTPQANMIITNEIPRPQTNTWYPDSGASHHVTPNAENLHNRVPYAGQDQLYIGNGQGMKILSTGNSVLSSQPKSFVLKNILHVPTITKNLLSVHQFTLDNNVFLEFHPYFCLVKDNKTRHVLLKGTHKDGLYVLHSIQKHYAYLGEKASTDIWHNRLGHPHFRTLQHILKNLALPLTHQLSYYVCDACCSSKSHKQPFKISLHKSTRPLELVHSDVWGPAPLTSHFGFQYYVIFVDDYSKYTWLFPLKNKSDVFHIFTEFHTKAERQSSQKLCAFQSDWGGEFQSLNKYLKLHGIHHRVSCPYTPEQNGTAERKHRHLIETSFALLKQASLPTTFWDEAVTTASFLINRMPTPLLANQSPYEILFKRLPDYIS